MWKIEEYQAQDSSYPIREYLKTLGDGERRRFATRLQMLAQEGLGASDHLATKLEDNLYELCLPNSPHNPRFLYCAFVGRTIYLLHGFSKTGKSDDKVPKSEKRIATNRRQELSERMALEQKAKQHPKKGKAT